jgi:hypothetical protein
MPTEHVRRMGPLRSNLLYGARRFLYSLRNQRRPAAGQIGLPTSWSGRFLWRRQRNGGFAGEYPENERFLKIQLHGGIGMA